MVGDQPIYKSEIEEAYQQALYEKTPIPGDPMCVIPEQLAVEKLFLHQADIDTVEVSEAMVTQSVDQRVNYRKRRWRNISASRSMNSAPSSPT